MSKSKPSNVGSARRETVYWDSMDSSLGRICAAWGPRGICRVERNMETSEFIEMLETEFRGSEIERNPDRLAPLWAELERFFAGEPVDFDFPVDLSALTPFQQAVLEATRAIPPGQVMTYGQIAAAVGSPRASRAVGQALRRNPVPFVIPCHRVVGSDGSMRGYGGPSGVQLKEQLLALEEQS